MCKFYSKPQDFRLAIALLFLSLFGFNSTKAQINTEMYRNRIHKYGINFQNKTELSFKSGNSDYICVYEDVCVGLQNKINQLYLIGHYKFKESDKVKSTNEGYIHLRWVRNLNSIFALESFTQKGFDQFISLKDRNLIGVGAKIKIIEWLSDKQEEKIFDCDHRFQLFGGVGVMFENENYNLPNNKVQIINLARSTNYINFLWKITKHLDLSCASYYQPAFKDFKNFRMIGNLSLEIQVAKHLAMTTTYWYRYDSKPTVAPHKLDQELIYGLNFSI
ncbi:MAG: DUF481 domain-containing protein [Bacteroidales bacterium]